MFRRVANIVFQRTQNAQPSPSSWESTSNTSVFFQGFASPSPACHSGRNNFGKSGRTPGEKIRIWKNERPPLWIFPPDNRVEMIFRGRALSVHRLDVSIFFSNLASVADQRSQLLRPSTTFGSVISSGCINVFGHCRRLWVGRSRPWVCSNYLNDVKTLKAMSESEKEQRHTSGTRPPR